MNFKFNSVNKRYCLHESINDLHMNKSNERGKYLQFTNKTNIFQLQVKMSCSKIMILCKM